MKLIVRMFYAVWYAIGGVACIGIAFGFGVLYGKADERAKQLEYERYGTYRGRKNYSNYSYNSYRR